MKRRDLLAAGAASLIAPWAHAQSQAWPTRGPIRLICQFPPGGLVDTVARLIAPHLQQALSQTVLVENRPGAGGLVGTDFAARQNPDGYSLLVSHASVHVYATATRNKMPFDAITDFTHMAMLVEAPMVLLVRPQSPFKSLADYVAAARVKPVRYGSSGIGSANHLFGEMLKIEGNAPMHDHVPYQGSAPALAELPSRSSAEEWRASAAFVAPSPAAASAAAERSAARRAAEAPRRVSPRGRSSLGLAAQAQGIAAAASGREQSSASGTIQGVAGSSETSAAVSLGPAAPYAPHAQGSRTSALPAAPSAALGKRPTPSTSKVAGKVKAAISGQKRKSGALTSSAPPQKAQKTGPSIASFFQASA
jgi:hypothetical protein